MKKEKQTFEEWMAERRRASLWIIPLGFLIVLLPNFLRNYLSHVQIAILMFAILSLTGIIWTIVSWRQLKKESQEIQKQYDEEDAALFQQRPHS